VQQKSLIPVLDMRLLAGSPNERRSFVDSVRQACCDTGAFYVTHHSVSTKLSNQVLEYSRNFFELSLEEKLQIDIKRSPHFRGYSQMSNERDWREQLHFGCELPAVISEQTYYRLQGPNLWPSVLGEEWKMVMLEYLDEIRRLGEQLLPAVAEAANLRSAYFNNKSDDQRYVLMKLIYYWPQSQPESLRNGVAAHCDWSWITILLQDDTGLQIQSRNGQWIDVPPIQDNFVVNLGELVHLVTGGYFVATPHRVVNSSSDRARVSIPVFINPGLDEMVTPVAFQVSNSELDHIHRVIDPATETGAFMFGESEWQRKGLGRWCYDARCY